MSRSIAFANLTHLIVGELRTRVGVSGCAPARASLFPRHVAHVVAGRAEEQVIGANTGGVVAPMQYRQARESEQELRRYVQARGWEGGEFVEHGVSGANDMRPQLDALMTAVRRKRVDAVVSPRERTTIP